MDAQNEETYSGRLLNRMSECNSFYDVEIIADKYKIKAHKNILASASDVFKKELTDHPYAMSIDLSGYDGQDVRMLLDFIYTGVIPEDASKHPKFGEMVNEFKVKMVYYTHNGESQVQ